jgi:TonB family protein
MLMWLSLPMAAQVPQAIQHSHQNAYVYCSASEADRLTPVYEQACMTVPMGRLKCGQPLDVVAREDESFKIVTPDGVTRYIGSTFVSLVADKLVAPAVETLPVPNCKKPEPDRTRNRGPEAIDTPDPEYSAEAEKAHLEGTVGISLVVGTDGHPSDIQVEGHLGKGLDERAVEAVQKWRFKPALKDGLPVPMKIYVTVVFKMVGGK